MNVDDMLATLAPANAERLRLAMDPVRDTQSVFRAVLQALAWPGGVATLPVAAEGAPGNAWAAAVLITLTDHETTLAAVGPQPLLDLCGFVRQRTNVGVVPLSEADFVVLDADSADAASVPALRAGTLAYPDESATVLVLVPGFGPRLGVPAQTLRLEGPGIEHTIQLTVQGLSAEFIRARNDVVAHYPRGFDLLLIDPDGNLVGLPRTTVVGLAD